MNKTEEKKFDNLIDIDKTRLDDECENQPYLVWEYGKGLAKAILDADEAKAAIKVAEAEVDISVREAPEDYDLDPNKKPSEEAVKKAIIRSKEYKEAIKVFNRATFKVNMFEAAVRTLDHRRSSLSMLDGQDTRGYYSRPHQSERKDTGKSPHRKPLRKRK
ncbi:hypothetical protein AC477_02825 [miscellaneous Crenarchaeota group-1 archaeon SG8-32-1]|uniref:Uncharacterized protein n=1 Tax=miscellaneous Crenarchaeota group-1 archaeon SG8-32-1 TaxID=1685124 RepID=A0A0M0BW12_9ARCH|nr:MAG: hypothetical protein AC477_02825 [miscellaneous Crenarchaeota group-1 archaeon SG8-32-1]